MCGERGERGESEGEGQAGGLGVVVRLSGQSVMANCSCFGTAASSKVPLKRYNQYVKDVFEAKEDRNAQNLDDALPTTTAGKIRKLTEYGGKNPHRIPKIARRLRRRAETYAKKKKQVHRVHVVVRCYEAMLREIEPCPTSMMAVEIHHVIGLLVSKKSDENMDFQGLQLLFVFLRALHDASQWSALEKYFADVFRHASRREDEETKRKKQKCALLCAGEAVRIIGETFHYFPSFEIIVHITLDALDPQALEKEPQVWNPDGRTLDELLQLPLSSIAWKVFGRLEELAGNAFGATRVFQAMLQHFDQKKQWMEGGLAFPCLRGIAARNDEGNQGLVLLRILLRHAESRLLPPEQKPAFLEMVHQLALKQMHTRPVSALILYVREMAPRLPSEEHCDETLLDLRRQMLLGVQKLASCTGPEVSLADTMASLLYTLPKTDPERLHVLACVDQIAFVLETRARGTIFPRALFRSLLQTYFFTSGRAHEQTRVLLVRCYKIYPSLKPAQWNLVNSTFWQVATDDDPHGTGVLALGELHRTLVLQPEQGRSLQSVTLAAGLWKHALEPYSEGQVSLDRGHVRSMCLLKVTMDIIAHLIQVHEASSKLHKELQRLQSFLPGTSPATGVPQEEDPTICLPDTEEEALESMRRIAQTVPLEIPALFWTLQDHPTGEFCRFIPPRPLSVKPHLRQILEQAATFTWSREESDQDVALPPAEAEEHEATSSSDGEFEDTSQTWDEQEQTDVENATFVTLATECSSTFATYQEALRVGLT